MPTLAADSMLSACLVGLCGQTLRDFEVVVVDNSGRSAARSHGVSDTRITVLENKCNVGFGAAINEAFSRSRTPYLATLNDDAVPEPGWLEALVAAMESDPGVGMCASKVLLAGDGCLDSAGMLVAADGSSKQRGHRRPPEQFARREEVFFPSACAALYLRAMLEEVGLFDEEFFLYCEDTDLGLRGRWAGWRCLYVPDAVVEHRYSHSAGRASPLKAYYVERNRLFVLLKNFPIRYILTAPCAGLVRYFWHVVYLCRGRGAAARFRDGGHAGLRLPWMVLRAHLASAGALGRLWRQRRAIRRTARLSAGDFCALVRSYSIALREVAAL